MAEELKALIEKIQAEGIDAAETKAKEIEEEAKRKADAIIKEANKYAEEIVRNAEEKIAKLEKSEKKSVQQAARNLLISVNKELTAILNNIITAKINEALNPKDLAKIISSLVKNVKGSGKKDIEVSLY